MVGKVGEKFGNKKEGFEATLKELDLDVKDATLGNAIPAVRAFNEFLVKTRIISKENGADHFKNMVMKKPSVSSQPSMAGA